MTGLRTPGAAAPVLLALVLLWPAAAAGTAVGDVVPSFRGTDLAGGAVSVGPPLARKRLAILFWDWRRAASTRAMQELDRLQEKYGGKGLAVIAVEGEGTASGQVLERVERLRGIGLLRRCTVVPDPGGRIARQFGVESTPQLFLVDGTGRVFEHFASFGVGEEVRLEHRVRGLLGLSPPSPLPAAPIPPPAPPAPEDPVAALREKAWYFGNYHLNKGEPEKAEQHFRRIVEAAPEDVAAWLLIGEACARQGRYDQAREAWERVLRVDPGNPEADANIRRLVRGEY